jgi:hypothetical protein
MNDKVMIFPPDNSEPLQGFFAVTLARNGLLRALAIVKKGEWWSVTIDGSLVDNSSKNWPEAFGHLYKNILLNGRRMSRDEYQDLLRRRIRDQFSGVDANKPLNFNEVRIHG